ncbi:MAG TPA: hypothetical protein VFA41_19460 [Ktedonobacteraceae bacterium]|nr:hypothetical protein [Ktedonobacteraceae bacterium]
MNTPLIIWHMHLTAARGAFKRDTRTKVIWLVRLIFDLTLGYWSFNFLLDNLARWNAAGTPVLESHLWVLLAGMLAGICFLAVLAVIQEGFNGEQALLLFTLPLALASRFRALYGLILYEGVGNWLLLAYISLGIPLALTIGWLALPWLLLLTLGAMLVVGLAMLATLLVIRYVLPHPKISLVMFVVLAIALDTSFILLSSMKMYFHIATASAPLVICLIAILSLLLLLGPGARLVGALYEQALLSMQGYSGRRVALNLPGMRALTTWLYRYRNLTGALLVKGLLNQSRNVFTWARLLILLVLFVLFPLIEKLLVMVLASNLVLVVVYASVLAILTVIEYALYAISSEGARLSLYLLAPFDMRAYLCARIFVFLLPAIAIGAFSGLFFSLETGLTFVQILLALVLIVLALTGFTAFIVLASISDEDLNMVTEGMMQALMQEEMPLTPRRLQLLSLSIGLLALLFFMIWKLPFALALPGLALLAVLLLALAWRYSLHALQKLLRQ